MFEYTLREQDRWSGRMVGMRVRIAKTAGRRQTSVEQWIGLFDVLIYSTHQGNID